MEDNFKLPIEDTATQDLRRLFIQFFASHFDRMMLVQRPQRRDPAFKQAACRLALHNPVYCLTVVAKAQMDNITNANVPFELTKNHLTDLVYTRLLEKTRQEVVSFNIEDVDVLLLAVVTLCEYDLKLDRHIALRSHHAAMLVLVSRRGGAHNLGLSLPDVLRMDRFLAVRLNQLPQFNPTVLPSSDDIMRRSANELPYGFKLHNWSSTLSDEVFALCSDSAQLLALMDELDLNFESSGLPAGPNPKLEYFYFLREIIDVRHAILNYQSAMAASSTKKDLLVLTATHIVVHYVAYANYPTVVTDLLATRLWNLLTKALLPTLEARHGALVLEGSSNDLADMSIIDLLEWTNSMPMLLWLLFVCALPSSKQRSLSFAGRVHFESASFNISRSSSAHSHSTQSPTDSVAPSCTERMITSPSSPQRHRHLPSLLLHVAEHLIGERPLSGTSDWDGAVADILNDYAWASDRLSKEICEHYRAGSRQRPASCRTPCMNGPLAVLTHVTCWSTVTAQPSRSQWGILYKDTSGT